MVRYRQTPNGCLLPIDEKVEPPKYAAWPGANVDATKEEIDTHLQAMYRTCGFHKVGGRCWGSPSPDPKLVFIEFAKFMYGGDWYFKGEEYC